MPNPVRMICPNLLCRAVLAAPANARGKKVRCRACGMRVQVPTGVAATSDTADASQGAGEDAPSKAGKAA
ncbi:MAG: hypothetical protein AAGB29_11400 [Planctomycetota bacterium]